MPAVIFDLDGTLVNSQPLQYKAYKLAFEQFGSTILWEDWVKYWVHESISSYTWIKRNNLDVCGDTIKAIKVDLYNEMITNEMELKLGALDLVNRLYKEGIPMAIASTSRYDSIYRITQRFFPHQFSILQSDVDLGTRKPDPHIFLVTAEKLQTPISQCVVVEDSVSGYKAGLAAGMKVVICPDNMVNTGKTLFPEADLIVDQLSDLSPKVIMDLTNI